MWGVDKEQGVEVLHGTWASLRGEEVGRVQGKEGFAPTTLCLSAAISPVVVVRGMNLR